MNFGCSVGDFVAALQLANKIRERFVDAPEQFKAISDEVRSLSIVLDDVKIVLPQRDLTSEHRKELVSIIVGCYNVLNTLDKILGKYQELGSNPKDCDSKSFRFKARRGWKRLRWEPDDIKELRSRITSNISLLNAFNGQLIRQVSSETKKSVDRLHQRQDDQERQTIIEWLTRIDYASQQSDFIGRRQEGTGQWLLNSDEFQRWLNTSKQTLFCPGMPGAGKTMITSIIVDYLSIEFQNDPSVGIAYLYCNFRRQDEQKTADLFTSLLKQLMQGQSSVPESVKSLYERHKDKARPSLDEILEVLHAIVADYSRTFILIDALDECPVSDGVRSKLLSELFRLQGQTGLSLFATSRFIPEIEKEFEGSILLKIRASIEDVKGYLDGHMSRLPSFVSRNPDLQEEIKAEIIKAVDGMFLLAQLHLDSLIGKKSPKAIRIALKKLPKGSEALDTAYKEAMERIEGQIPDSQELATQVLSWITCSKRPLITLELQHALAVEIGESELDEENLPEIEDMISVCAGLVTVDDESDIIRLIHYTTQEFFERTQKYWFPDAETDIAKICVTYLSFDVFETGFCPTDEKFEARLQLNILYDYAARNWGYHALSASAEVGQLILGSLKDEIKVSASSQAMMASRRHLGNSGYSQRVPRQMTGVHLGAYFGLRETVITLLRNGHDLNVKDGYQRTPLLWAAVKGHEALVKLLLAKDGVDPDSKDVDGRTPLSWAAGNGHEAVVKLLLATDGVDINLKHNDGCTPLSWAAASGHETVAKLLLAENCVDTDPKDNSGRTPLSWAARYGHEMVVKLLFATDRVDPDYKDKRSLTPLSWAAVRGHEAEVKLLLATDGVDPDSKDIQYGRTPLSWAARNGHEAVVKLLLATDGVNPDSQSEYGRTPLSWAAGNGREAVVRLLMDRPDVEMDSKDTFYGRTPLSYVAEYGHEAIVRLLVDRSDVEADSKDKDGRTPLSFAAAKKQEVWMANRNFEAVMELLFSNNRVDINTKDTDGRTPLSWAAGEGQYARVKLLLAKAGIDSESKDDLGQTPLQWATKNGHEAVIELLQPNNDFSL